MMNDETVKLRAASSLILIINGCGITVSALRKNKCHVSYSMRVRLFGLGQLGTAWESLGAGKKLQ